MRMMMSSESMSGLSARGVELPSRSVAKASRLCTPSFGIELASDAAEQLVDAALVGAPPQAVPPPSTKNWIGSWPQPADWTGSVTATDTLGLTLCQPLL